MKYQSEIVNEILEKRGHEKSSLHYQSECVELWIEETKGSYPKLCDYEGEWLNYIAESPIGEFPYVTLSDVTEATVNNVVPYAYKSAILKGNTLSANPLSVVGHVSSTFNDDNSVTMNADGVWHHVDYDSSNYVGNKATFVVLFSENTIGDDLSYFQSKGFNVENKVINTNSFKFYGTITGSFIRFGLKPITQSGSVTFRVMLLDGDYTNHDIPYFEGIKSVKIPVLTTSNEDGTKTNILTVNEDVTLRSNRSVCDELDLLTGKLTQRIDEDGEVLPQEVVKTVELNIVDQNGNTLTTIKPIEGTMHLSTDGETIKPTFTGEIPVEAIKQNLASFIEE